MRDGGRQIKSGKGDGSQTKARVGEKIRGKVKKCNEGQRNQGRGRPHRLTKSEKRHRKTRKDWSKRTSERLARAQSECLK